MTQIQLHLLKSVSTGKKDWRVRIKMIFRLYWDSEMCTLSERCRRPKSLWILWQRLYLDFQIRVILNSGTLLIYFYSLTFIYAIMNCQTDFPVHLNQHWKRNPLKCKVMYILVYCCVNKHMLFSNFSREYWNSGRGEEFHRLRPPNIVQHPQTHGTLETSSSPLFPLCQVWSPKKRAAEENPEL